MDWDPDRGTTGITAAKSQFLFAAKQIATDLGMEAANVKHSIREYGSEFDCNASGEASTGIPRFEFWVTYVYNPHDTQPPKLNAAIEIAHEEHAKFEFDENITSMVDHPNFLIRWAGWAVHNFNLLHHPLNLDSYIGMNYVHVYGEPQTSHPNRTEFRLLMKGLQASNSKVTILKLRHVDSSIWYRSFSYGIWAETEGSGLWVVFCRAGGLDSGGWYEDYKRVEELIHELGENVIVKNYDIKETDLERFLLRRGRGSIFNSLYSCNFDIESFHQYALGFLDTLGQEISEAYRQSEESFWNEDYDGALRDLRALVQEALEYVAQHHAPQVDISDISSPNITKLAGRLIDARVLDGELAPWFGAFTSFANLSSHGTFPTRKDLQSDKIRMRVLGTFVLGRQLLIELKNCIGPS